MSKGNAYRKRSDPISYRIYWGEVWHPKTMKWAKRAMERTYRRKNKMKVKELV